MGQHGGVVVGGNIFQLKKKKRLRHHMPVMLKSFSKTQNQTTSRGAVLYLGGGGVEFTHRETKRESPLDK